MACLLVARSVGSLFAAICPKSGVKPTCRDSPTGAIDLACVKTQKIWKVARMVFLKPTKTGQDCESLCP